MEQKHTTGMWGQPVVLWEIKRSDGSVETYYTYVSAYQRYVYLLDTKTL